jgi:arylsulfatase A-like enzyme
LTVFYSTAHFPYAAPAPYYRRYTYDDYDGRFKYYRPVGLGREAPPDEKDTKQIQGLYDGAVASIDAAAGKLLATLESRGLADDTIVIITGDHGETLYESAHGQGHGDHLFGDEGTHVPLIVYDPRAPQAASQATPGHSRRVTSIARDVDIAPTLYELTGVEPPDDLDGRSLAPALSGGSLTPALAFAETGLWFTEEIAALPPEDRLPYPGIANLTEIDPSHGDEIVLQKAVKPLTIVAKHRMVRDEKWKLIYMPTRSGVKYMLFDTEADPGETRDVSAEQKDVLAKMKAELWAWMLRDPNMVERGGYLVPRDVTELAEASDSAGIRLGDIGRAPPPSDSSQEAPPEGAQP